MKIRRAPHVAWRAIADETVVLNLASKQIYGLSPVGAELWAALEKERTFEELGGDADVVSRWLNELRTAGLVEIDGELPTALPAGPSEPILTWVETLERAVGQCAHLFGQSDLCNQSPGAS